MQTAKVGSLLSELVNIMYGFPQGASLGPFLFNIYFCDLCIINKDINFPSYAGDITPFVTGNEF